MFWLSADSKTYFESDAQRIKIKMRSFKSSEHIYEKGEVMQSVLEMSCRLLVACDVSENDIVLIQLTPKRQNR